jgi:serine protease Do
MEGSRLNRNFVLLGGIGLVLVGLLAGILVMLVVLERNQPEITAARTVERVQLGSPAAAEYAWPSDSDSATLPGTIDAAALSENFREVARRVTPAVVFVQVESAASVNPREWMPDFEGNENDQFFPDMPRQSVGSGVIISRDGYIVTNNHVVAGASDIQVTLTDKRQFEARVIGLDPATDLGIIKIDAGEPIPTLPLGNSDEVQVGDWAIAIGNPFRLTSTVTAGIVSALGRQVNIISESFGIEDFIQTDAAINPGNSGGALVNTRGELIGISTAIATESGSYEGYGFAVPVNLMRRVVEDLIEYGEVQRGFLGVTIDEISSGDAERLGLDRVTGVYLREVRRDGAADRAGLRSGDVVLSINDNSVDAPNELQRTVAQYRPGDKLALEVWRGGTNQTFEVELLGRDTPSYRTWFSELRQDSEPPVMPDLEPDGEIENFEISEWGLGLRELDESQRQTFGIDDGVYISFVRSGSNSSEAGLPRDVVISSIDGQPVGSVMEAVQAFGHAMALGEPALFRVKRRNGTTAFYEVEAPSSRGRR